MIRFTKYLVFCSLIVVSGKTFADDPGPLATPNPLAAPDLNDKLGYPTSPTHGLPATAAEFCDTLKLHKPPPGKSLKHISDSLGFSSLGALAKDSEPWLNHLGFTDLLPNSKMLKDSSEIPEGSILILDKAKAPGCPVSSVAGDVAVVCGPNQLYMDGYYSRNLKDFVAQNPKCIKAVMYNKKWDAKSAGGPQGLSTPADPGAR